MDQILEKIMDRYLELPKRRRKEINDILKEIKRTKKNEVIKNGATT
jgi:CRISPR/Cas system-associated exonuclease Cas4 (RecB family)